MIFLLIAALAAIAAFMLVGIRGNLSFVLPFRAWKLFSLLIVASSIAISTVIFQTVTANRILTPSIMGFDALYALIQTLLIFFLGSATVFSFKAGTLYIGEVCLMMGASLLLCRLLFTGRIRSLHLMLLIGIVAGSFFRSLSGFFQRVIDPTEFVVLQDRLFASFNSADRELTMISAIILVVCCLLVWHLRHDLDVMSLGRDNAIALGVDHDRVVRLVLIVVSTLVSVSTALVGPVTFFGLLVASIAYALMPSGRHVWTVSAAVLVGIISLVGGQTILERLFAFDTALSIIIEFLGGILFILMALRKTSR